MDFWKNKKVLVTGGAGFVGSYVVEMLVERGARTVVVTQENETLDNLTHVKDEVDYVKGDMHNFDVCEKASRGVDIVLNVAAIVGGINFNQKHPGTIFRDNVLINTNMLEAARLNDVERFLVVSSACVYPRFCKIPTPETEGFEGMPEPTNDGYGWSKRMAEFQAGAYAREFGMKIAIARPFNTYGPRDHFDPEKSHVIPALIKRVFDGENPLTVWGDGEQSRAFLYVTDFARGLLEITEKYAESDPLNLGTDEEIKIKDLASLIIKLSGFNVEVSFDTSRPSGQLRRNCDNTKAMSKIGFEANVRLEEGLKKTIEWYAENQRNKR